MDPSLPVLVTLLPEPRAVVELVRAALRYEVAQVALMQPPRESHAHALELRVAGASVLHLVAEPVGPPQAGRYPLRLRPRDRAQASELYSILEADEARARALGRDAKLDAMAAARTPGGGTPSADSSGVVDLRKTARMPTNEPRLDPRRTVPSAQWSAGVPAPAAAVATAAAPAPAQVPAQAAVHVPAQPRTVPRSWVPDEQVIARAAAALGQDPKRTVPSAMWRPETARPETARPEAVSPAPASAPQGHGADAPDATIATSAVFDLDERRTDAGRALATAAVPSPAQFTTSDVVPSVRSGEYASYEADELELEDLGPWDDGPSLSVSVVFDPERSAAESRPDATILGLAPPPPTASLASPASPASVSPITPGLDHAPTPRTSPATSPATRPDPKTPPDLSPAAAGTSEDANGGFFDDALSNFPQFTLRNSEDATEDGHTIAASDVLAAGMGVIPPPSVTEPSLTPRVDTDFEGLAPSPESPRAWRESDRAPWDEDDDFATLIRLPGQGPPIAAPRIDILASLTADGFEPPASSERAFIGQAPPRDTAFGPSPISSSPVASRPKKQTTGGRTPKSTRNGKPTSSRRGQATAEAVKRASYDAPPSSRRWNDDGTDPLLTRKIADGKYVIESAIGSGAAGAVYKATHRELRRSVAIKVLHPHYQQDPHFMKSFRGEALAASQLDHPNVMRVLDFGQEPDGLVYIVMEYLSGRTLQSLLDEERRLPPDRAVGIMIQVCAALSVAHDHGIIHRDIKPDNIMLVPSRNDEGGVFELVKVCDFGIAALQNPRAEDADLDIADNIIAGTPEYMSPEQARGSEIGARSDVYACGICLYELVTGRPPFLGETAIDILDKQVEETPRPPSQLTKGLDSLLEEIILRAIQKDPDKRQQSARELRVELKELLEGDASHPDNDDDRSIVENIPVLDDPASGFPGFFIALSSAVLRLGRFERGHPESSQAMKELLKATRAALRGRGELTFARRDTPKSIGYVVMTGHAEIVDLKRLLGTEMYGSFGYPFIEAVVKKGVASLTLREGLPDSELSYLIEMLLSAQANDALRKEVLGKSLRHVSLLFVADVIGRDRKLSWKVGLTASRLARDLNALSNVRGISLKKMRESRDDLVKDVARLLTKGDEVRQFLFNADLVDEAVANLRGFSAFQTAPLLVEHLLHESCAEGAMMLVADFDAGDIDPNILNGYLRLFANRLLTERSPKSDAAVTALYQRSIVRDEDVPRDLKEQIRAESLAEALMRDPSPFLRTLDAISDPDEYGHELATLEAAMAVLARRAEAGALLAAISVLARHARGTGKAGPRENHALATMKSIIDKQRLVPVATALLSGPAHQREPARHLLVLAGSAGAHALFVAREGLTDAAGRSLFVQTFRDTGPAGWALLLAVLPRLEVQTETDVLLVEDLLRAVPDRQDLALGEAVAKFLAHPRLRPAALSALALLWGEHARKSLLDALEFAEEPTRIVALNELRRIRCVDEQVVGIIERLLTMKGSASEDMRAAAAAALADSALSLRVRVVTLLAKGVEGKRGFVAMLRGDGGSDESILVTEAMARSLLVLDRNEGLRVIKARLAKSDAALRARLAGLLQGV